LRRSTNPPKSAPRSRPSTRPSTGASVRPGVPPGAAQRPQAGGARPAPARPAAYRGLAIALGLSLAAHAGLLALRFAAPSVPALQRAPQIDVVLVNSKTEAQPEQPQALAQHALDGGGNTDADHRTRSPLPATGQSRASAQALHAQREQLARLEREQQQLLTQLRPAPVAVPPPQTVHPPQPAAPSAVLEPRPEPVPQAATAVVPGGAELAAQALALARLEAQIDRETDLYQKRPRRRFVGARTREARFALYVDAWREKVERVGNDNYPLDARGRLYGSLTMSVSIRADGTLESVEIDRPSGHRLLDDAARRIVTMASPYARFPEAMRRDTDILVITRTWYFEPGDTLRSR
jgi:periplasmic protein TonB